MDLLHQSSSASCRQQLPGQPIRIILFLWLLLIYLLYSLALPWSSSPPLLLTAVHNKQAAILRLDQAIMDTFWNQSQQQKQYYMSQGLQFYNSPQELRFILSMAFDKLSTKHGKTNPEILLHLPLKKTVL
jgi:hypothetical protein